MNSLQESRRCLGCHLVLSLDMYYNSSSTKCNTGLGFFQDNPELLRKAADYLEEREQMRLHDKSEGQGNSSSPAAV